MLEPRHCDHKGEEEQVQQAAHPHVQGGAQSWVRMTVAGLPDSPPTYHKMGNPRKILQTASKNSKVLWGSLPDTCRYHTVLNKGPLCPFLYSKYTQTFQKKTHTWNRNSSLDSAFRFECSYLKREAYCLINLNCSQNINTQENFEKQSARISETSLPSRSEANSQDTSSAQMQEQKEKIHFHQAHITLWRHKSSSWYFFWVRTDELFTSSNYSLCYCCSSL